MDHQFKKGDYIVILRHKSENSSYIKYGYCFKQYKDSILFGTERDLTQCKCGTNISFDRNDRWRYATPSEIIEYKRKDRPFYTPDFTKTFTDNYEIF
jgi:hypothetical protein